MPRTESRFAFRGSALRAALLSLFGCALLAPALAFQASGGGCVNAAYSTFVVHEYGHWLNDLTGSFNGPGGFGEGAADSWAVYVTDQPIIFEFRIQGFPGQEGLAVCYGDVTYTGLMLGTSTHPFARVADCVAPLLPAGEIVLDAGTYPESLTLDKAMTTHASGGVVRIGG